MHNEYNVYGNEDIIVTTTGSKGIIELRLWVLSMRFEEEELLLHQP
jgi:hypothetical protein